MTTAPWKGCRDDSPWRRTKARDQEAERLPTRQGVPLEALRAGPVPAPGQGGRHRVQRGPARPPRARAEGDRRAHRRPRRRDPPGPPVRRARCSSPAPSGCRRTFSRSRTSSTPTAACAGKPCARTTCRSRTPPFSCARRMGVFATGPDTGPMLAIPLHCRGRAMGVFNLFFGDTARLPSDLMRLLGPVSEMLDLVLDNAMLEQERLQSSLSAERQMFASEIHDSLAQGLAFMRMRMSLLQDAIRAGTPPSRSSTSATSRTPSARPTRGFASSSPISASPSTAGAGARPGEHRAHLPRSHGRRPAHREPRPRPAPARRAGGAGLPDRARGARQRDQARRRQQRARGPRAHRRSPSA